ncbi:hypothetical protein TNCV_4730961 [Trichonephila clavipes]|nr:hypothetical protein TNCV_4730961 [Trichonephila clavipes]
MNSLHQKDHFPDRELVTSQRLDRFVWESIPDRASRRLCSKASQRLKPLDSSDIESSMRLKTTENSNGLSDRSISRSTWMIIFTVTYQGPRLRAFQCHLNATFYKGGPVLTAISTALALP